MTTETQDIIYEKHNRVRGAAWVTVNRPQVYARYPRLPGVYTSKEE